MAESRLRLLVLLAGFGLACGTAEVEVAIPLPPVVLAPVQVADVEDRIEVTGQLIARNQAQIAAEVSGRITEIVLDEGQEVTQDDVLLEIDPERRQLELASARARLSEAQVNLREQDREFRRFKTLRDREITSASKLDQVRTQVDLARSRAEAAEADVHMAERALRDSSVRAPFSGRVARRFVSRGEFVNAGARLIHLVAQDPIEIEFHVAERDSARILQGQQVRVSVDPHPEETFRATVTVVSPTIDARTRTLRVLAQIENPAGLLRPGLFARADLGVARREDVISVPEEAVLQRADGAVVFRVGPENRVERVNVETGAYRGGFIEVVTGLSSGDRVVTRGHGNLLDGTVVSPRNVDGSLPTAGVASTARVTEPVR